VCKKSVGKVLAAIFWDQDGILLIVYVSKGQTINAEYYLSLLVPRKDILKEKRHGYVTKGVLFLHNNAPAYWTLATQKKLACLGFQCLDYPSYAPDLAPSEYHLFPGLKKTIERLPFFVRCGSHCYLEDLVGRTTISIFFEWLKKLEQQAKKCIELRGEHVE